MKKAVSLLCVIVLFFLASCGRISVDYTAKLISVMNDQEKTTVKDIFSFEFDRAYIFHQSDCYFDGETFNKKYNLDISVDRVDYGTADYLQRIVFVDESGNFVYLFKCVYDKVNIESKGVVIYPETVIERKSLAGEPLKITFDSLEKYGS